MLQNIFHQLTSELVEVSQSPAVSFVVEELVQLADEAHLTALLEKLSVDWEIVCCHRLASHVTEAIVKRCGYFLSKYFLHCSVVHYITSQILNVA